jgi:hypothetical protein
VIVTVYAEPAPVANKAVGAANAAALFKMSREMLPMGTTIDLADVAGTATAVRFGKGLTVVSLATFKTDYGNLHLLHPNDMAMVEQVA